MAHLDSLHCTQHRDEDYWNALRVFVCGPVRHLEMAVDGEKHRHWLFSCHFRAFSLWYILHILGCLGPLAPLATWHVCFHTLVHLLCTCVQCICTPSLGCWSPVCVCVYCVCMCMCTPSRWSTACVNVHVNTGLLIVCMRMCIVHAGHLYVCASVHLHPVGHPWRHRVSSFSSMVSLPAPLPFSSFLLLSLFNDNRRLRYQTYPDKHQVGIS